MSLTLLSVDPEKATVAESQKAVENNLAKFDNNSNAVDAGIAASELVITSDIVTNAEVSEVLGTYFPQS